MQDCSLYWFSNEKSDQPRGQISDLRNYGLFVYQTKPLLMKLIPLEGTGKYKPYSLLARTPGKISNNPINHNNTNIFKKNSVSEQWKQWVEAIARVKRDWQNFENAKQLTPMQGYLYMKKQGKWKEGQGWYFYLFQEEKKNAFFLFQNLSKPSKNRTS